MAHHPANVAGGEVGFARLAAKNVLHAGGQRHGIATGVALHALGLTRRAAGVQGVTRVGGVKPLAIHHGVEVLLTQRPPQVITPSRQGHASELAIHQQHRVGLMTGQADGLVQQRLVFDHLATARTCISTDDQPRRGILNARGQRARREAAKNHRMNGTDTGAGQHGKSGLGNHGHVNQDPVPFLHAQLPYHGGHTLDFSVQFAKGIDPLLIGFR